MSKFEGAELIPRMSPAELQTFTSFLRCSKNYMEFGSGGSTYVASSLVQGPVTAVDSSKDWLLNVQSSCLAAKCPITPTLIYVDIGTTGDWGVPIDPTTKELWPSYYEKIWMMNPIVFEADVYLIDGRFRVACFLRSLLNCRSDARIIFHDFSSREYYKVVQKVACEIATTEDLSVFSPLTRPDRAHIYALLDQYRYDTR